ncbi:hypothetical protein NDU88_000034 [Pleurodeles waltl]|uniref:Uncharacterized protein n=1 Tax=Pleurodeles waltl TaxID=8319 RepID=A0AAV7LDI7_PLEWA|nr:hypothetical protein NDU88_000034 [Pleurodeles waltl]
MAPYPASSETKSPLMAPGPALSASRERQRCCCGDKRGCDASRGLILEAALEGAVSRDRKEDAIFRGIALVTRRRRSALWCHGVLGTALAADAPLKAAPEPAAFQPQPECQGGLPRPAPALCPIAFRVVAQHP